MEKSQVELKRNVIFFEGNPHVGFGGGQRVSLEMARFFLEHDFRIFFVDLGKDEKFSEKMDSYSCERIPLCSHKVFLKFLSLFLFIKRNGLNAENTFVYSATKPGDIFSLLLKIIFNFKVVSHIHMMKEALRPFYRIVMSIAYHFMDSTIAVSKTVLKSWKLENSFLLYNPIITSEIKKELRNLDERIKKIAIVGHIVPEKGVEKFLETFSFELTSKDIEIYIWGKGSDLKFLEGKYPHIHWMGFSSQLHHELVKCDLLVLPSLIPEAFGLVIAEASSLGLPCLTTNFGAQQEIVNTIYHQNLTFSFENSQEFWEGLGYIEKNYLSLSQKGSIEAQKYYSLNNFNRRLEHFMRDRDLLL